MIRKGMRMNTLLTVFVLIVFATGLSLGGLIGIYTNKSVDTEAYQITSNTVVTQPLQQAQTKLAEPLHAIAQQPNIQGPQERNSPGDWITEDKIELRKDGVYIRLNDPQWAILANTNSMDPVFDDGSHLIQTLVSSQDQIRIGDIITYKSPLGYSIVHRVTDIGEDEEGWYAITKGDNNPTADPWKVRFEDVTRVTVMIIY